MATRRERVVLELEDLFSAEVMKAAASAAVLKRELNSLSGTSVRTSRDNDSLQRSLKGVGDEAARTSGKVSKGSADIDRFSGRLQLFARTAALLGPAIAPIGGAAIPAIAGLTAGLGAAAAAFGVTLLAVQGLGDGLKALDAYQLEPTKDNLEKLRIEMDKLGPAGAEFVRFLDDVEPQFKSLQQAARAGLFPGVEVGINALLTKLPQARRLIFDIADALGDVAADTGRGLAGEGLRDFFNYLKTDAAPTLKAFAEATGNVATGIANLIVGVAPLTRDFTGGMVSATAAFENWTASLSQTQGFQDFLAYIQQTGPQVVDLVGQLALSLASIVEAAAPVGRALLPALTAIAQVVETIASSDLGTPLFAGLAAMSALRLGMQAWGKIAETSVATIVAGNARAAGSFFAVTSAQDRARMSATQLAAAEKGRTQGAIVGAGKIGAAMAGLALATSGLGDSMGASNTASMALMGTMAGPWGAAIGGATGAVIDFQQSSGDASQAIDMLHDAMKSGSEQEFAAALAMVNEQLDKQTNNSVLGTSFLGDHVGSFVNMIAPLSNVDKIQGKLTGSTKELADAAASAAPPVANLAVSEARVAHWAGLTRSQVSGLVSAMEEQRTAALQAFDAVTQYAQALMDARKQAEKSNAGIRLSNNLSRDQRTEVIANRTALSGLVAAWNNQSDAVRNNVDKLHAARTAFVQTATAMGVPIEKARELATSMLNIPDQRVIQVKAITEEAQGKIRAVRDAIATLHDKNISINVQATTTRYIKQVGIMQGKPSADGGSVPKTGLPYADRHPYLLADGEEVISNRHGQADRHRSLLKAINAGRLADGGTVGGVVGGDGGGRSTKELQRSLDKLTKSLDADRAQREDWIRQRNELRSSVRDGLRSDIFATGDVWSAGRSPVGALRGDIRGGRHFIQLIRELRRTGVDGAALQEIIASGDVQRAELMASMSRSGLHTYERLYNQRERVLSAAGSTASTALGFGRHIDRVTDEIKELRGEVKHLQGVIKAKEKKDHQSRQEAAKTTADGVNGASRHGHRKGGR